MPLVACYAFVTSTGTLREGSSHEDGLITIVHVQGYLAINGTMMVHYHSFLGSGANVSSSYIKMVTTIVLHLKHVNEKDAGHMTMCNHSFLYSYPGGLTWTLARCVSWCISVLETVKQHI